MSGEQEVSDPEIDDTLDQRKITPAVSDTKNSQTTTPASDEPVFLNTLPHDDSVVRKLFPVENEAVSKYEAGDSSELKAGESTKMDHDVVTHDTSETKPDNQYSQPTADGDVGDDEETVIKLCKHFPPENADGENSTAPPALQKTVAEESEEENDSSPADEADDQVQVSKFSQVTKEYQQPVQEQPMQKDQIVPSSPLYEQVREPEEVKRPSDPEEQRGRRVSIDLDNKGVSTMSTQIQTQPEVVSTEPDKFRVGDRVVGTLGDFGTVAVSFGSKDYGVDFDNDSKYRVTEDQLQPLPEQLDFDIGATVVYERKNGADLVGRVEKFFGNDVYGIKFLDGRKFRVKGNLLQPKVPPELEGLKERVPEQEAELVRRSHVGQELKIDEFTDISTWNHHSVVAWLNRIGLAKYRKNFEEDYITGRKLLTLTGHNLADIGVKRKDRPVLLKELDKLRNVCLATSIPGSQGLIMDFKKRPFDFEIECYESTLTVTEISSELEKAGVCRGMKIVSCNGTTFRQQSFDEMLDIMKTAILPATIKFEKILVKVDERRSSVRGKLPLHFGKDPVYIIKQGWLYYAHREPRGKEPVWKKRWCVLQSDDTLHLYNKPASKKSRKFLPLNLSNMSTRGHPGPGKDYFLFVVPCRERTYKFKCLFLNNLNSWITAINEMFTSQKKRARKAPLPQGPSRIIETLIKKNELSALWRHPQNGRTALQLCLEMNKMNIILRYINNDLSLLRLSKAEGGLDLHELVGQALEFVMSVPKNNKEDVKHFEDSLTLIGTIYDRTPLSSWHKLLLPPATIIDHLMEYLHVGTKESQERTEPPLDRKIALSCEAVIATVCQPGALRPWDNLHQALIRCFENRAISHLFEILLKTDCNLHLSMKTSLLYRAIDLSTYNISPIRWNHMFEMLVRKGAPVSQLSHGDQADVLGEGIDALTKSISLLHIESIQIMLRLGTEIKPVHTRALFTLVTRPDVMIIDKQKFLETLETLLTYGAELSWDDWLNLGSFVKANGEDLKRVGERAAVSSKERIGKMLNCLDIYLGTDETIMNAISGYFPQFNSAQYYERLGRFLEVRRKCLEKRFPREIVKEVVKKEEKCVVQ